MREIHFKGNFGDWQAHARDLLRRRIPPQEIVWTEDKGQQTFLGINLPPLASADQGNTKAARQIASEGESVVRVPRRFMELAKSVAAFRDPKKWYLLYSVLWRIAHENHDLLKVETDDEVIQLLRMEDAVSRDVHHVHAFVRFKKVSDPEGDRYVAWYKPDHKSIELAAPFFAARFAAMRWSILTPDGSAHWDGKALSFSAGVETPPASDVDGLEDLWCKYYATTFNPARTNVRMMRSEMPQRFWKHMPELANLPYILERVPERVNEMLARQKKMPGAGLFVPPDASLDGLRQSIAQCKGCELYQCATQPVFGEGSVNARIAFVGEQPGDQEDRAGRPFVGPAGEVFNRALREAQIAREDVYVTNVVKHFAFDERGKRRIHRTPRLSEVIACRPWLEAELAQIAPDILVCLGATAARAILGAQFRLTEQRGKFVESRYAKKTLATYHPSAVLRADTQETKEELYTALVKDLTSVVKEFVKPGPDMQGSGRIDSAATRAMATNRMSEVEG